MNIFMEGKTEEGLSGMEIEELLLKSLGEKKQKKVLIIPPDYTRYHSNAGMITNYYYHELIKNGCHVDILIAQGTHEPITKEQFRDMYGDIPYEVMIPHRWREDTVHIGVVPAEYIQEISEGIWNDSIAVEVNRLVLDQSYDLILSVGQVVPHEVIGMANHSKNIFVGVGGSEMINKSHMVGAVYGMERIMGKDHSPVRKIFDYSLKHFLNGIPLVFVLTVTDAPGGKIRTHGLYIGDERKVLEEAIERAQEYNISFVDKGIQKCIVYLDPREFQSTWLGNKAVYRTRMAMADGGELIILGPGISRFGEDRENDKLIRRYGYCGRKKTIELFKDHKDLRENMGTAAHLIHGSSDGRFQISYAVKNISKEEIEGVYFGALDYDETIKKYNPEKMVYGWNVMPDGEKVYYIPNPALGLWINRERFVR